MRQRLVSEHSDFMPSDRSVGNVVDEAIPFYMIGAAVMRRLAASRMSAFVPQPLPQGSASPGLRARVVEWRAWATLARMTSACAAHTGVKDGPMRSLTSASSTINRRSSTDSGVSTAGSRDGAKEGKEIMYLLTDEAPRLAAYALLPVFKAFLQRAQEKIELSSRDISLAARILAEFPEVLTPEQRVHHAMQELAELVKLPGTNLIKLPNISASIPQLNDAVRELQSKGFKLPDFPFEPKTDLDAQVLAKYQRVLGSAVNPVLREGNSDRRCPPQVKAYAQKNPHKLKPWQPDSKCEVAHMNEGDFFQNEKSCVISRPDAQLQYEFIDAKTGEVSVLKSNVKVKQGDVVDASFMSVKALNAFYAAQIAAAKANDQLLSVHLKCTMMRVSDPVLFGRAVEAYLDPVFRKHGSETFTKLGIDSKYGLAHILEKVSAIPDPALRDSIQQDIKSAMSEGASLAMVDSDAGISNLHAPSLVIIDASMPVVIRDGGMMYDSSGQLKDTRALIPDRCYATTYKAAVEYCKRNGQFSVAKMGSVSNVGLMAQKAEEYGSHDKTFILPSAGVVRVSDGGNVLMEHNVDAGDVYRSCITSKQAVDTWIELAVERLNATGEPAVFWLDADRAHDANLIMMVESALKKESLENGSIYILPPEEAMLFTLERVKMGLNTISVTGNVLRDYLTDLFPILEVGTSAKMLSIVPLLARGRVFETGAGGSAPKHVQQLVKENHLRWDSLGEYMAFAASLEFAGAKELSASLLDAVADVLEHRKSPGRKVAEIDNRATAFYLAMYWARRLASTNPSFAELAQSLEQNEKRILEEIAAVKGKPADLDGYFLTGAKAEEVMRPSQTFNTLL
ncbi:Isocitrate dehydrogenase NADP [Porphyridium purpureum]|uniref:Isocitrate dehydrogenase NADP n=1 Tax=Porphyridium purpureum TaxID=35688 RepID=A0A5J4Z223_PORPP|nr:Isocitrate dehydrogenase NADP [Porphyridium purpureum]|eukprot:POR2670..scf295_1